MGNTLEVGKVQIYTGDGKGKTTAALGLALRAMGHGLRVTMLQFAKKLECSEHIQARRMGLEIVQADAATPRLCAEQILDRAFELQRSGACDVLILDEVGAALSCGLIEVADIERLVAERPERQELVLTGRGLERLAYLADLVTEMVPLKHYFDEGLLARKGIEY